jgi:hypothetical protein
MSDAVGLGEADASGRWIGIRRHQAVLVIIGILLIGDFITRTSSTIAELVTGVALVALAVPTVDGLTCAEIVIVTQCFLVRPKWMRLHLSDAAAGVEIDARATVCTQGFELHHRGRLDLSGRAEHDAVALAQFVDALAVGDDDRHVSLHVCTRRAQTRTLLSLPPGTHAPEEWKACDALVAHVAGATIGEPSWHLERWRYLRNSNTVLGVLRVRDFSGADSRQSLLDRVQFACDDLDVVVHVDVIGARRGARLSARAVHRQGSDDASSRAAGFRRTARSARVFDRMRQRESSVAEGRALLRVGVFLVVRAATVDELGERVELVRRRAGEAGLRCERGLGRQGRWFALQLPGGPGW